MTVFCINQGIKIKGYLLIYIKDFCDLVSKVIDKKIYNEVFNAGSGASYSISDTIYSAVIKEPV